VSVLESVLGILGATRACFSGDTLLLTDQGRKRIDAIRVGDKVLSRDEFDARGELAYKEVQEVFVRTGRVLRLTLIDNVVIRTTAEHPFWSVTQSKWTNAGEMVAGEILLSHDDQLVRVVDVEDTGEYATVYNLRVADYHTYFVGGEDWGFSVWAHNLNCGDTVQRTVNGNPESVVLPKINFPHLRNVEIDTARAAIIGFHILPAKAPPITSTATITIPHVKVLVRGGGKLVGATVEIKPSKVPASPHDMIQASVRVYDAQGNLLATKPHTTFFPPAWTTKQIETAVYSAYEAHYTAGGSPFAPRLQVTTPQHVNLEISVKESGNPPKLSDIPTAYPTTANPTLTQIHEPPP
jgi:hypothetical protein